MVVYQIRYRIFNRWCTEIGYLLWSMYVVQCCQVPSLGENKQDNYLLAVAGFQLSGSWRHQCERMHTHPACLSAYTPCNAKARTCAPFLPTKETRYQLFRCFSRGIASIVDCYLCYFICLVVYASAYLSLFFLVCCSTDEMLWIIKPNWSQKNIWYKRRILCVPLFRRACNSELGLRFFQSFDAPVLSMKQKSFPPIVVTDNSRRCTAVTWFCVLIFIGHRMKIDLSVFD